jgi:hypothetical protein
MIVTVNYRQLGLIAAVLKANLKRISGLNFYSFPGKDGVDVPQEDIYPPLNHPRAIDLLSYGVLQQHGFWYGDDQGYVGRLRGRMAGSDRLISGSELIFRLLRRQLDRDPGFFDPAYLAAIEPAELAKVLRDDANTPWPDFEVRLALTHQYGRWLVSTGRTPADIVRRANTEPFVLAMFLKLMETPGSPFAADPFKKKSILLAMALANRPEQFLHVAPSDPDWRPAVDYQYERLHLRWGTVLVHDADLHRRLVGRIWISADEEYYIRKATYEAAEWLRRETGLPADYLDYVQFSAGRYCPELTEPNCEACQFKGVCQRTTTFFQPTFRTTAY